MDAAWFKDRHRTVGVTQADAAAALGRAPTFLTRIYSGDQQMRLPEAQRLAEILRVSLSEVLERAGLPDVTLPPRAKIVATNGEMRRTDEPPPDLKPQTLAQQTWVIETDHMSLLGYLPGDRILVDLNLPPQQGDAVIAQVYDWQSGTARTVLRTYQPPWLLRPGLTSQDLRPETVDGERVMIRGVVVLCWRGLHV